ncbi:uncharacterized protein [Primulina huaijiensis]|uniref:uncharacterized protein n=1 Tax=Primulina huaijiensis TaxID=1492673 RepID=UPI003CC70D38
MAPVTNASEESMSPYYIHHSDSPGLVLVSQPLTGDNFTSWHRAMIIALSVKNKLGFVDGSIPKPDDPALLNSWKRNNGIVTSWILNSVSKEISASIIFTDSALDIWQDLKERFQQSNGPRIFQLRRELINHRQGQMTVSTYFTKLKTIWEELNNFRPQFICGSCCEGVKKLESHHQMDYVLTFLMGFNESFSQVRMFAMIIQEERHRQIGLQCATIESADGMAFTVKGEATKFSPTLRGEATKISFGGMGSALRNQPSTSSGRPRFNPRTYPKERPFCSACNMNGHTVDTCYKIPGYPPGFKFKSRNQFSTQSNSINQVSNKSDISDGAIDEVGNKAGQFFQSR